MTVCETENKRVRIGLNQGNLVCVINEKDTLAIGPGFGEDEARSGAGDP